LASSLSLPQHRGGEAGEIVTADEVDPHLLRFRLT
jgi:hypothetical protein